MTVKTPESHLASAAQIHAEPEVPISHPPNPQSEVYLHRLRTMVGKMGLFASDGIYMADLDKLQPTSFEDFVKKEWISVVFPASERLCGCWTTSVV